ncbi:MAG: transglycosylase domain-containing protein, partial [Patescibacteria group bacterium]
GGADFCFIKKFSYNKTVGKKRRLFLKIIFLLFLMILGLALFGLAAVSKIAKELPNPEQFASRPIIESTKIYDRAGEILLYEIHGEEKRTVIPFGEIPDYVKKATLTIEDRNFYTHQAFDWRAVLRALIVNIIEGRVAQGGSTITQQLAKNTFLKPEKTIERKIKEVVLAYWLERNYSKDEIFNLYLNQISYGASAYGIEAAAKTYFDKSAKGLTLSEAATLAALPRAPTYYSPWGPHADELERRRNYILEQMLELGFIDEEEKERSKNTQPKFAVRGLGSIKAPHFVMMVRDYLVNKHGEEAVEKSGFKVITTLDWKMQEIAERVVGEGAERNELLYQGKNAALVAQDPKTGQILALVGSRDYFNEDVEGKFNVAVQGLRQPGSALKPFAYLTAFKKGYTPDTFLFDLPTEFSSYINVCPLININYSDKNPLCFHPQNFSQTFQGPVTFRQALAQSINVPSVKVLYLAGLAETIKTSQDFGITTLNDLSRFGLSLVLGGGEVKLIEMVGAYSVFSQEGVKHQQSFILRITDNQGMILEQYRDQATQVAEPQYIRLINNILSDEEARRPLFQNSFNLTVFPNREVALKTGTTNDFRDAWAIGYTPSLVVGVWAGNNDNKPMQKQAGSILAAVPIWHAFLNEILNNYPEEFFNRPESLPLIEKLMFNGNYIGEDNQFHDILYYIDKNDPLGPIPENPEIDSQFYNWEEPVKNWKPLTP